MKSLLVVAGKHGLALKQDMATSGVTRWTIATDINIADVSNFINEVGYNGILITASVVRRNQK